MKEGITTSEMIGILALVAAFWLALFDKEGWGWMLFLAFCLLG